MENSAGEHPFFNAYHGQTGEARGNTEQPAATENEKDGPAPPEYDSEKPGPEGPHGPGAPHHHDGPSDCGGRRGRGGQWGRGGWGGRGRHGGFFGGGFPFGGPPQFDGPPHRGGWGGFGHHGPRGRHGPFDLNALSHFLSQRFGFDTSDAAESAKKDGANHDKDFTPPCDVFDTPDAYILHLSLPGAKKEDVGVNWDADKSELSVAGVMHRIGDEEMLKTLAMDEREVGVFERKIRLGSRANPANVEVDSISARMEDGVLIVTVPKHEEFVEIKKVDIN